MSFLTSIMSMPSSERKSVNSKLVSNSLIATITEPMVISATTSKTLAVFLLWNRVAKSAELFIFRPRDLISPAVFSTTTCTAPTNTVLATKAETTPSARVNPKVRSGASSEPNGGGNELARKAKTVVITARESAKRSTETDSTHACAALSV